VHYAGTSCLRGVWIPLRFCEEQWRQYHHTQAWLASHACV
jgi:hypothetical protein